ncbi:MAG: hypothetical protein AABX83_00245 [Nanoarchaeota archaeon]
MAYLFCKYKEERNYLLATFQVCDPRPDEIASCWVNKLDFIASDKEYGLVRLLGVNKNDRFPEIVEIEIEDIVRKRHKFNVPIDNVQMNVPANGKKN